MVTFIFSERIMQSHSRGAKMVLIALKKQEGKTEEWQVKNTFSSPSAELITDSKSKEEALVESGMLIVV